MVVSATIVRNQVRLSEKSPCTDGTAWFTKTKLSRSTQRVFAKEYVPVASRPVPEIVRCHVLLECLLSIQMHRVDYARRIELMQPAKASEDEAKAKRSKTTQ